ncbi:hypothetical protein ES703_91017 [subsurface metagenome]
MKEGDIELLNEIARFEDSHDIEKEFKIGWSWRHVRIWPATLNRLFKDGYLDNVFKSNSYTGYRLTELGKAVATQKETQPTETLQLQKLSLPDDIFGQFCQRMCPFLCQFAGQGLKLKLKWAVPYDRQNFRANLQPMI